MLTRPYTFSIPANSALHVTVGGDFLRVLSLSGPTSLMFHADDLDSHIRLEEGEDYTFHALNNSLRIENETGTPAVLEALIGFGKLGARSVVTGTVSVAGTVALTDYDNLRTLAAAGSEFWGSVSQAAVAAQYSYVQLWNPAGSGKVLYLRSVEEYYALALEIQTGYVTALTGTNGKEWNKNWGAAAGAGELRNQANAGTFGTWNGNYARAADLLNHAPIRIPAGAGVLLKSSAVNVQITTKWEWSEYTS